MCDTHAQGNAFSGKWTHTVNIHADDSGKVTAARCLIFSISHISWIRTPESTEIEKPFVVVRAENVGLDFHK